MIDSVIQGLVERTLTLGRACGVEREGLRMTLGPSEAGDYVLEVKRSSGGVGEREAVTAAVAVHRLLERMGQALAPEMLAFRGGDRSRCFVLAVREPLSSLA